MLRERGYAVEISGTIGNFKVRQTFQQPDLILLDVMLPDGNGTDLCIELKTSISTAHIPIIIMSAHATDTPVIAAPCAEEFISKPFDLDELTGLITKHLPI